MTERHAALAFPCPARLARDRRSVEVAGEAETTRQLARNRELESGVVACRAETIRSGWQGQKRDHRHIEPDGRLIEELPLRPDLRIRVAAGALETRWRLHRL